MEAREAVGKHVPLTDPAAIAMWPAYVDFIKPNLGSSERWVPYHTALGVHEFFLISSVHHRDEPRWDEKRRFFAIFVFRAHCKRDFFTRAQLPHLLEEDFWRDPVAAFAPEGLLEQSMRHYRRTTKLPLLTLAMRMIPTRILEDNDDNLVRSIVLRTQTLLKVANRAWPVIKCPTMGAAEKFERISALVRGGRGLGDTWAKLMTVCIDLAYPKIGLLASQCNVGIGALGPLWRLFPNSGLSDPKEALTALAHRLNCSGSESSQHFWNMLPSVEKLVRDRYQSLPLILEQVRTRRGEMSAVTLQVQLCEYRQFRNVLAKLWLGLPYDASMKLPVEDKRRPRVWHDEAAQSVRVSCVTQDGRAADLEVPVAMAHCSRRLAERVARMCCAKLCSGASREEALAFRDELCRQCRGGPDAPESSAAWGHCQASLQSPHPQVQFRFLTGGEKIKFATTLAKGGSLMEVERISRLCYAKFEAGASKQSVKAYQHQLLKNSSTGSVAKRSLACMQ